MLLKTKFLAPAFNTKSVIRQRLLERLQPRSARKLLLVSAPAGYGKTTVVLQWLHSNDQRISWLSLDENDNSPTRFWQYFIGACATSIENFGDEANQLLINAPQLEAAVTALINELSEWSMAGNSLSIVLDDFHNIVDEEILRSVAYLVDFLPPNIEIVITTRFEPALPISRWSVKNWVDAIYAADLVFSFDESKAFFSDYMSLSLTDKQVEDIHLRTEGWIAAMQLTALSASSKPSNEQQYLKTSQLLADERHFSDYVITEILEHQEPKLHSFLLESSCLLRLNAELCDAIRERKDSQKVLQALENKNLFVIPMDSHGEWYRYHEMFRDSLLNKLKKQDPERLNELQHRAVDWLLANDQEHEAIEQAVQLKDWDLLAELLIGNGNNLIHEGHHLPMLQWLAMLSDKVISASPRLLMLKVWALFFSNKMEVIQPLLDELENLIDDQRIQNIATSTNELIDLHSEISLIRSYLARTHSDISSAHQLTQQVLEELDNTNMPLKSVTYYGIGLDSYTVGDLASAEIALVSAIEYGKREKKYTTVLSSSGLLGWIYYYQGKLEIALETGIQSQQWIDSYHDSSQPRVISCWQNSILAMIYTQRAELTIARSYINPLLKHIAIGTEPGLHIIIQYTYANVLFAEQKYIEAIECLDDAIQIYEHKKDALVFKPPSLSAFKSRCLLAINRPDSAKVVLDDTEQLKSILPLNLEDIRLCQVRTLIKQKAYKEALDQALCLEDSTKTKQHLFHLIQARFLIAIASYKLGNETQATNAINLSLREAAKDGFIAIYLNEHSDTAKILALAETASLPDSYLQRLSTELGIQREYLVQQELPGAAALEGNLQLLEPLSQRELEVLRLIDEGLANKEIARKLSLAPATVKAHIRNIYGKISAKSRTEALSKARQLQLI
jgi:LuxR family maltose regulon positive regulatory protein